MRAAPRFVMTTFPRPPRWDPVVLHTAKSIGEPGAATSCVVRFAAGRTAPDAPRMLKPWLAQHCRHTGASLDGGASIRAAAAASPIALAGAGAAEAPRSVASDPESAA